MAGAIHTTSASYVSVASAGTSGYQKSELSEWFGPTTAPGTPGVYNASCFCTPIMARYWDGSNWSQSWVFGSTPNFAVASAADQAQVWWRGLLNKPEEKL